MRRLVLGLLGLLASFVHPGSSVVRIELDASWPAHDLLHEALETLHTESPSDFWKAVGEARLGSLPPSPPKARYEAILQGLASSGLLQAPGELQSLVFSLALREASPKLEAFAAVHRTAQARLQPDSSCDSWVDFDGRALCSIAEVEHALQGARTPHDPPADVYTFDHVHPFSRPGLRRTATLYASASAASFQPLHLVLAAASQDGSINYILRWKPSDTLRASKPMGWGVALDLKKTDYLVIDDRDRHDASVPASDSQPPRQDLPTLGDDAAFETEGPPRFTAVAPADLSDLSIKATQFIMSSSDRLSSLRRLAQDLPLHAHTLATRWVPEVDQAMDAELLNNSMTKLEAGQSGLWLNGLPLGTRDLNAFSLLEAMRDERRLLLDLQSLDIPPHNARCLLANPSMDTNAASSARSGLITVSMLGELYDADDLAEGAETIFWWNDLENDRRYLNWGRKVSEYLRPTYPGQMTMVARNGINVVLCLNLLRTSALSVLANQMAALIKRQLPIRWGFVPVVEEQDDGSRDMALALRCMTTTVGRAKALQIVGQFASDQSDQVDVSAFVRAAAHAIAEDGSSGLRPGRGRELAFIRDQCAASGMDEYIAKLEAYRQRLDIASAGPTADGVFFVNGAVFSMDKDWRAHLQQTAGLHLQFIQQQVYLGNVTDTTDLARFFYGLPEVMHSRRALLSPSSASPLRVLNLIRALTSSGYANLGSNLSLPEGQSSLVVVGDLTTAQGRLSVSEALSAIRSGTPAALSCLHLPTDAGLPTPPHSDCPTLETGSTRFASERMGMNIGEVGLLVDGRVIVRHGAFTARDFEALVAYEQKNRLFRTRKAVQSCNLDRLLPSLSVLSSVLWSALLPAPNVETFAGPAPSERSFAYKSLKGDLTAFEYGSKDSALFEVGVVLDPTSDLAQSWSSILSAIAERSDVYLKVWLNPTRQLTAPPIRRLYRHVLAAARDFTGSGDEIPPSAAFSTVPAGALLSTSLHAHPSWVILASSSVHDLDNIVGKEDSVIDATFEIDSLLIEGHAREATSFTPPRGLQVDLVSADGVRVGDTIVMANLGYFQFKTRPGPYRLSIRQGPSADAFSLTSLYDAPRSVGRDVIELASFTGVTLFPTVARRRGFERADLLTDATATPLLNRPKSLWARLVQSQLAGWLGLMKPDMSPAPAKLNIFTVASGLLYERMAYIMCLSVMKHTSSPVKFWFIGQFLSPSFRSFIPHLAKAYGFEYELVTYQWPHWLRAQQEKQRVIWGYKILFLDVLFPLGLDRVIFVDSDQIVRTDLQQLANMDLHGAPYAYAPMGSDREETQGFRFWETGYWQETLRGRPYHISALYLVDLKRFRQIGAGDILRQHYQALSADPGSLANLDQDLPNNLQDHLPIHTLHQSWLWCETWCADAGLKEAKTIDLCNNPLTHEPKLARARRLLPEWDIYDQEVAQLAQKVSSQADHPDVSSTIQRNASELGQAKQQAQEWDHILHAEL